jgi:hypothetical protein
MCGAMTGCRMFVFKDPTTAGYCAGGCWLKTTAAATLQSDSSMVVGTLRRTGALQKVVVLSCIAGVRQAVGQHHFTW